MNVCLAEPARLNHPLQPIRRTRPVLLGLLLLATLLLPAGRRALAQVTYNGARTTVSGPWVGPVGVALDSSGNLYIGDCGDSKIIKKSATDGSTSTYLTSLGGTSFSCVQFLMIDSSNNLYIADTGHSRVIEYSLTTSSIVRTITGVSAAFGMALDSNGNLFIPERATPATCIRLRQVQPLWLQSIIRSSTLRALL